MVVWSLRLRAQEYWHRRIDVSQLRAQEGCISSPSPYLSQSKEIVNSMSGLLIVDQKDAFKLNKSYGNGKMMLRTSKKCSSILKDNGEKGNASVLEILNNQIHQPTTPQTISPKSNILFYKHVNLNKLKLSNSQSPHIQNPLLVENTQKRSFTRKLIHIQL